MYAAHFAVSLGLKAAAPRVPIPALLMAGLAPDVAFALLMRTGVEHIDAPVGAPYADWRIVAPYSHGAVLAASGVLLFGVGLWLTSRKARVGGDERPLALAVLASARHAPGGLPGGIRCVAISASSPTMSWTLRLATAGLLGWLTWLSTIGQRGATLIMPSPDLAESYLWQILRDLILLSVLAVLGTTAVPTAGAVQTPLRDR